MKTIALIITLIAALFCSWLSLAYRNIESVKARAESVWNKNGFQVVGYEGYQSDILHGGNVWYMVSKNGNTNVIYTGALAQWGGETHIYNLRALNAVSGH